jgi:two-component system, OmpR family, phosphate regulon sensor histidine kinase PhoR
MGNTTLGSPLFRKLLFTSLLLILTALVSADFLLTRYIAARERAHAGQLMEEDARILGPELATVDPPALQTWTARAGMRARARVTVIARDGVVLADSQHDPATMDNHATRPEVLDALAGRTGIALRRSATVNVDLYYLAVPVALQGHEGAQLLRFAVPLESVGNAIAEVRWLIVRVSAFAALLSLVVAYIVARAFTRRIRRIQGFAQELVKGDFAGTLAVEADDELGSVARSLRGMAEQFRDMLDRLSREGGRRQAILASMVEGVLAVDRDLRITFYNDALARALHFRGSIPEGIPLLQVVRDPSLKDLMTRVLETGEPSRTRLTLSGAGACVFEAQAAPLDAKARSGAIAILHDITELEHLERVRKDFVANLSHELRTPLAAIRGYAETLLDGAIDDPQNNRRFLEIIITHTVRLADMASDLLALAELESERGPLPPERVSVREAVESAMRTVKAEARSRLVRLSSGTVEDVFVMGQKFRLEHALVNLLANAIKYNRPGGEVRLEAAQAGDLVRISVRDSGIGISSEELRRIFERFYCVDKARSRATGGTGLGLAIVKHITERMSGTVNVESQIGKGSTFTLLFPTPPTI